MSSLNVAEIKDHSFLSKEVLIPNLNNTDSSRVNMFCSHIDQSVVLAEGEFPRVFTNFENQVGHHSSSYRVADRNWTVVSKIIKNEENFLLVVRDQNGYVDIVWRRPGERITEYFGYKNINDGIDNRKAREEISEGEVLHHSTAYDENLNFKFGCNLKAVYLSYQNMTFEDAIVISKSAADKMKSYTLEEISVSVNTNDVLTNLYGNYQVYKSFPDIGEHTKKKILTARRRINHNSIFFDHSRSRLNNVNYGTDTCFYSEGIVVDIDVFGNADLEELSNKPYNHQIVRYLKGNLSFYQRVVDILEPIINRKGARNYSDDTAFLYKKAKEMLDPEIRWHSENNDFDNFIIKFLVLKEQQLAIGSKLTNRSLPASFLGN